MDDCIQSQAIQVINNFEIEGCDVDCYDHYIEEHKFKDKLYIEIEEITPSIIR